MHVSRVESPKHRRKFFARWKSASPGKLFSPVTSKKDCFMKRKFPLWLAFVLLSIVPAIAQAQTALPELVRHAKPSVVGVISYDAKGEVQITGTGFFVRPGQVITNLHVIDGARRVDSGEPRLALAAAAREDGWPGGSETRMWRARLYGCW